MVKYYCPGQAAMAAHEARETGRSMGMQVIYEKALKEYMVKKQLGTILVEAYSPNS
ncbi:hypothetical protein HMPREF0980_01249 [Dorea sp. D27]|nr:hypothetical protein HMPREF0980_01249 [Dorea sp. D27]